MKQWTHAMEEDLWCSMKHLEVDLSLGVAEALLAWVVVQLLPCYLNLVNSKVLKTQQSKKKKKKKKRLKQAIPVGKKKSLPQTKM